MTPRYVFMLAVLLGPFGCDSDPARGPKPETRVLSLAVPASDTRLQHFPERLGRTAQWRDRPEQADLQRDVLPG